MYAVATAILFSKTPSDDTAARRNEGDECSGTVSTIRLQLEGLKGSMLLATSRASAAGRTKKEEGFPATLLTFCHIVGVPWDADAEHEVLCNNVSACHLGISVLETRSSSDSPMGHGSSSRWKVNAIRPSHDGLDGSSAENELCTLWVACFSV